MKNLDQTLLDFNERFDASRRAGGLRNQYDRLRKDFHKGGHIIWKEPRGAHNAILERERKAAAALDAEENKAASERDVEEKKRKAIKQGGPGMKRPMNVLKLKKPRKDDGSDEEDDPAEDDDSGEDGGSDQDERDDDDQYEE